jgi:hypothetical protein
MLKKLSTFLEGFENFFTGKKIGYFKQAAFNFCDKIWETEITKNRKSIVFGVAKFPKNVKKDT